MDGREYPLNGIEISLKGFHMFLNCLIYNDQISSPEEMETWFHAIPGIGEVHVSYDFEQMKLGFDKLEPDLFIYQMHTEDATFNQFWSKLDKKPCLVVCSENDTMAVVAYRLKAGDFLEGFLNENNVQGLVQGAKERILFNNWQRSEKRQHNKPAFIFVKSDYKVVKINLNDIHFIESLGEYIRINTSDQRIVTLQSLSRLAVILPQEKFIRIHRSYIINLEKINFIQNHVVSIGPHHLSVSKSYRKSLMDFVHKYGLF